jgi:hypothetical protein
MAMAIATLEIARGLRHLSDGLRATYMFLEEIKATIERQGRMPR